MKRILFFAALLAATTAFAQKRGTTKGTFEKDYQRSEFHEILGASGNNFLVAEGVALKGRLNVATRVFAINVIDKNSLKSSKLVQFDDIAMDITKAKYSYLSCWMLKGIIGVVVMDKETAEVKLLTIDSKTLKLSTRTETLFSISKQYEKDADEFLRLFKKQMYYNTMATKSLNEKYIHVSIITNGSKVKPVLSSILLDASSRLVHTKSIEFKTNYKINDENVRPAVSDNGSVSFLFSVNRYKRMEYIDLKPGAHVLVLGKEGNTLGWSELKLANAPGIEKTTSISLVSAIKDNSLFLGGYVGDNFGHAFAVADITALSKETRLKFIPFTDETKAAWKSVSKYEKYLQNVKKNQNNYVSEYLSPHSITIMPNGNAVLMGNEYFITKKTTESGTITRYTNDNILLSTFSPKGEPVFEKVIESHQVNFNPYNRGCFKQKAYVVNGKIAVFVNDIYDNVNGVKLQPVGGGGKNMGTVVFIEQDGSKWSKVCMNMTGDLRKMYFYSSGILKVSEQDFFLPGKYFRKNNTGYLKLKMQ